MVVEIAPRKSSDRDEEPFTTRVSRALSLAGEKAATVFRSCGLAALLFPGWLVLLAC